MHLHVESTCQGGVKLGEECLLQPLCGVASYRGVATRLCGVAPGGFMLRSQDRPAEALVGS